MRTASPTIPHALPKESQPPATPTRPRSDRAIALTDGTHRKGFATRFTALLKSAALRLWKPFTIFRFAGVPVQIHSTFLAYPVGFLLWQAWNENGSGYLPLVLQLVALVCFSLFVHEFAHIFAARAFGIGTERMIFHPFGAVACLEEMPAGKREFWIALAGPLSSLALAGVLWWGKPILLHWLVAGFPHHQPRPGWFCDLRRLLELGILLNLGVAVFNLLPCYPMDGGRILRSLLALVLGKAKRCPHNAALVLATRITVRWVSPLVVLGTMFAPIFQAMLWLHLVMFSLLLIAGELEYSLLRDQFPERESILDKFDRSLRSSRSFRTRPASFALALRRR